jgi:hypothetical protein
MYAGCGLGPRKRRTIVMLHGNGGDHSPIKEFYATFTSSPRSSTTTIAETDAARTEVTSAAPKRSPELRGSCSSGVPGQTKR